MFYTNVGCRAEMDVDSAVKIYEQIKQTGNTAHVCIGCNRQLDPEELDDFNQHVRVKCRDDSNILKAYEGRSSHCSKQEAPESHQR